MRDVTTAFGDETPVYKAVITKLDDTTIEAQITDMRRKGVIITTKRIYEHIELETGAKIPVWYMIAQEKTPRFAKELKIDDKIEIGEIDQESDGVGLFGDPIAYCWRLII